MKKILMIAVSLALIITVLVSCSADSMAVNKNPKGVRTYQEYNYYCIDLDDDIEECFGKLHILSQNVINFTSMEGKSARLGVTYVCKAECGGYVAYNSKHEYQVLYFPEDFPYEEISGIAKSFTLYESGEVNIKSDYTYMTFEEAKKYNPELD
ncbi:MAG: hypothetical protein J6M16_06295 [Clostridia bacterium]|nr:hypothetical protein [Clostridia bacterium]